MKKMITVLAILISIHGFSQTKNQQQIVQKNDSLNFHIVGKISDFELLYLYLKSPGDVTPNQKASLINWVEKLTPISDTTKTKK